MSTSQLLEEVVLSAESYVNQAGIVLAQVNPHIQKSWLVFLT
jgi:hypothetical protein